MKEKTRKILKRLGAGLLLGLSFLNFGTGWGKQKAKSIPRRAQNVRKETREELNPEVQQIADIAEKEAEDVINQQTQEQQQQQQMQVQTQARTQTQQFLRYATVGGWGIAMVVFFTSMVFNSPFGLGKAVLSLLPGEPHVAVLSAQAEKNIWEVGDSVVVDIKLTTNQEKVNYFKTVLTYNPDVLQFQKFDVDKNKFNKLEQNQIDTKNGRLTFIVKRNNGAEFKKDVIAKLVFKAKKDVQTNVNIIQKESLVLKTKKADNKGYNILGKTVSAKFTITQKAKTDIICPEVEVVSSRMNSQEWERIIKGAPIPVKNDKNTVVDSGDISLSCAFSSDGVLQLLFTGKTFANDIKLLNKLTGREAKIIRNYSWTEGDNYFKAVVLDTSKWIKEKPGVFKNAVINFKINDKKVRLPEKGVVNFWEE